MLTRNQTKVLIPIFLVLLVLIMNPSISCSQTQPTLTIFAAAAARSPLDEICQQFEEQYKASVEINYGGGGEVLSQMVLSQSGDVYIAPEQRFMETAKEKQAIDPETIKSIAYMVPVIAVPKSNPNNITSLADLAKPGIRVAVTRPETTLLGNYAPEIFQKSGLAEEIKNNIVTEAARPDNLLTLLMMGQVDAGIIWHFYQVQAAEYIEAIFLPADQLTGIGEMQAAISTYSNHKTLAQKFVVFLVSENSKSIFEDAGYIVNAEEVKQYWQ
ncbi:molybdate ABC transporter substrate-binding protein [Chloroflexota bacterium]